MYKEKECLLCKKLFTPTSGKQKYCNLCKKEGKLIADRKRDRVRSRKKNEYIEYHKCCKICGKEFTTYYKSKLYCGFIECELKRKYINHQSIKHKVNANRRLKRKLIHRMDDTIKVSKMIDFINGTGYKVISYENDSYISSHNTMFTLLCRNNHEWKTTFHNFKDNNNRCLKCYTENKYISKLELLLRNYYEINFPYIKCIYNDRIQLFPKELDFYFPKEKIAIEVCGLYWHSEVARNTPRNYHYSKMMECYDKGIRLMTIFEDELINNFDIVVSRINQALGVISKRVYARKCKVVELSTKEANNFFIVNHIQGRSTANKSFGLEYESKLVAVASVGNSIRRHTSDFKTIELKRFCTLKGMTVVGGVSKLFSHIVKYVSSEKYTKIKSYCDMRYASIFNPVYEKLGFKLDGLTNYTPHYFKSGKRYRNFSFRKTLKERLTGKTELELRLEQGYDRIWDCGHRTYVYQIS